MQRLVRTPTWRRLGTYLLVGALLGAPFLAVAALAPYDILGRSRASPTTIGALEIDSGAARPAAPTGLTVTPIR